MTYETPLRGYETLRYENETPLWGYDNDNTAPLCLERQLKVNTNDNAKR